MTTEDDFQRMLDFNPEDHTTRLILADYLQERDDPRWEGYYALGVLRLSGDSWGRRDVFNRRLYFYSSKSEFPRYSSSLPDSWYNLLPSITTRRTPDTSGVIRKELEDAAAIAFSRLTPEEKIAILHPCKEEILREVTVS